MDILTEWLGRAKDAHILIQFFGIFLFAAIPLLEAYIAVPVSVAIGFPLGLTIGASIVGNLLSVGVVVLISDKLQFWLQRRRASKQGNRESKRFHRAKGLFSKYGVPGVALIGPLLIGNHIGAFISIISGANKRYVLFWQALSIIIWAIGTGLLVTMGVGWLSRS